MKKCGAILGIFVLAFAGSLHPYETTVVPAWKLRVVDELQRPYAGLVVTQAWKDYSLETEAGQNLDTRPTTNDGYVEFPERKIKLSLIRRVFLTIVSAVLTLAHGSFGVHAYVHASGPQGYGKVNYVAGQPPPEQLVLPAGD